MTERIRIFTIGFTRKSAEQFFTKLRVADVVRVVDVRLHNSSQLAGFSKRDDLIYFLRELVAIEYVHLPEMAPTQEILDAYKKHGGSWSTYERDFVNLLERRRVEETTQKEIMNKACLLCSEHKPQNCHRRLVAEYLRSKWHSVDIIHLI